MIKTSIQTSIKISDHLLKKYGWSYRPLYESNSTTCLFLVNVNCPPNESINYFLHKTIFLEKDVKLFFSQLNKYLIKCFTFCHVIRLTRIV